MRPDVELISDSKKIERITMHGIPNCDTVKKARLRLKAQGWAEGVDWVFIDLKKHNISTDVWFNWVSVLGWELLINKKGSTWRKLPPDVQLNVMDAASALALVQAYPSVVKRPVVDWGNDRITVGLWN